MRESQIEAYLVKQAKAVGGELRKVKWIGRNGAPDRLLMLPARPWRGLDCAWCNPSGRSIWVELKRTGGKAEPHQVREHARMLKMGQSVVVIDSFDAVDKLLSGEGA